MNRTEHISIQIAGTANDRKVWKSIAAANGVYLGRWIREAIEAKIAAQNVQQNKHIDASDKQSVMQIEGAQS